MPKSTPFWDRMELALLRVLTVVLSIVDGLFKVRWGERLLDSLSKGWQTQLAELNEAIDSLEKERAQLQVQAEALAIHAAALYLGSRYLARDELRFDPADPRDEEVLDASIDVLVKQQLATIETQEVETEHYIYYLEPDWAAIHARLADATEQADPDVADWFREGLKFIDEAFLLQPHD